MTSLYLTYTIMAIGLYRKTRKSILQEGRDTGGFPVAVRGRMDYRLARLADGKYRAESLL